MNFSAKTPEKMQTPYKANSPIRINSSNIISFSSLSKIPFFTCIKEQIKPSSEKIILSNFEWINENEEKIFSKYLNFQTESTNKKNHHNLGSYLSKKTKRTRKTEIIPSPMVKKLKSEKCHCSECVKILQELFKNNPYIYEGRNLFNSSPSNKHINKFSLDFSSSKKENLHNNNINIKFTKFIQKSPKKELTKFKTNLL